VGVGEVGEGATTAQVVLGVHRLARSRRPAICGVDSQGIGMSAPPKRQRPELAGTGREVEQQIKLAAELYGTTGADSTSSRDGYRGTFAPAAAPKPRFVADIATDLLAAAARLGTIAGGMVMAGPTWGDLAEADRIVTGCNRLVVELRQRVLP